METLKEIPANSVAIRLERDFAEEQNVVARLEENADGTYKLSIEFVFKPDVITGDRPQKVGIGEGFVRFKRNPGVISKSPITNAIFYFYPSQSSMDLYMTNINTIKSGGDKVRNIDGLDPQRFMELIKDLDKDQLEIIKNSLLR